MPFLHIHTHTQHNTFWTSYYKCLKFVVPEKLNKTSSSNSNIVISPTARKKNHHQVRISAFAINVQHEKDIELVFLAIKSVVCATSFHLQYTQVHIYICCMSGFFSLFEIQCFSFGFILCFLDCVFLGIQLTK